MASITASSVQQNVLRSDGRRHVTYKYTVEDNDANSETIYMGPFIRAGAWDVAGNLSVYADALLASLQDSEDDNACNLDEHQSKDSLVFAQNPRYSTEKRVAKKLIRWMMRERDPRIVLWLEPLLDYLDANYTPTQLANWLDLTIDQLAQMKRKINAILEDPLSIKTGKTLISEFDTEQADWE